MELIIITIIALITVIVLKFVFDYNIKKIKEIVKDEELDEISKKYPSNIEICKWYLDKLNNNSVKIEENKETEASLYIVISNKILIADINKTYTRIQTIAHECLHSIQNKKILLFNFIYSNIYLFYYILICILAIFKVLPYENMFIIIFLILSLVYYMVRIYLENDAMIKARYLANDYIKEIKISEPNEIKKMESGFDKINNIGIKSINYNFFLNIMIKLMVFLLICIIR